MLLNDKRLQLEFSKQSSAYVIFEQEMNIRHF